MKLHEYQAKRRMEEFGLPVLKGRVITKAGQVAAALEKLGTGPWVLKAQVHTGGRGKAGGVRLVRDAAEATAFAKGLLGKPLITHQTGPQGLIVRSLLAEAAVQVEREFYAAVLMNRKTGKPVLLVSAEGGMDIETLAATAPEKIVRVDIDPLRGLEPFQARDVAFATGLAGERLKESVPFFRNLVRMFLSLDASLVEVNPLGILAGPGENRLLAMDAKVTIDDNASFRQKDLFKEADRADLSDAERRAVEVGISYIRLDGAIGCMVNGAGLAMATMDIIKLYGAEPANFLDVGGGATKEKVTAAFKIIMADPNVKGILVNIFGGIARCDILAQGVVEAVKETGLSVPLVVRLEGTNAQQGKDIINNSGLNVIAANDLSDGAEKIVKAVRGAA